MVDRTYDLEPFHAAILSMVQERLPNDQERRQAEGLSLAQLVAKLVEEWRREPLRIPKGTPVVPCRQCQSPVVWVKITKLPHKSALDAETGIRHLATCPKSLYLTEYQVTAYDRASNFGAF